MCTRLWSVLWGSEVWIHFTWLPTLLIWNFIVSRFIIDYINQPWVREEVGVDPSVGSIPSIVATNVYERFWDSGDHLHLNELYISELLEHGVRVLIYAGSYDWIANWVANERWTLEMEWSGQKEFRSQPLKEWVINGEPVGKYRSYGNLTFATIYSAGHMVSRTTESNRIYSLHVHPF